MLHGDVTWWMLHGGCCMQMLHADVACRCYMQMLHGEVTTLTSAADSVALGTSPLPRRYESRWTSCSTHPTTGPAPPQGRGPVCGPQPGPRAPGGTHPPGDPLSRHYCPGRETHTVTRCAHTHTGPSVDQTPIETVYTRDRLLPCYFIILPG